MQTNEHSIGASNHDDQEEWELSLYARVGYSWRKAANVFSGLMTAGEAYELYGVLAGSALPPWPAVADAKDNGAADYELRLSNASQKRLFASTTWPEDVVSFCVEDLLSLSTKTFVLEISVDAPLEVLEMMGDLEDVNWLELMETGALEVLSAKEKMDEN